MRELILILIYLAIAFAFVLIIKIIKHKVKISVRFFWSAWFICLFGAFLGGMFGSKILLIIGWEMGLLTEIIPAILGAWLLVSIFLFLRNMPNQW